MARKNRVLIGAGIGLLPEGTKPHYAIQGWLNIYIRSVSRFRGIHARALSSDGAN